MPASENIRDRQHGGHGRVGAGPGPASSSISSTMPPRRRIASTQAKVPSVIAT